MKILFLHGFRSSENSGKAKLLKTWFGEKNVISPRIVYNQETIRDTYLRLEKQLEELVQIDPHVLVIGSSFGGFMAYHLFKKLGSQTLLINPAITSELLLKGTGIDVTEIEKLTEDHDIVESDLNIWLAKDDERLGGNDYLKLVKELLPEANITEFENAGHRFTVFNKCQDAVQKILNSNEND